MANTSTVYLKGSFDSADDLESSPRIAGTKQTQLVNITALTASILGKIRNANIAKPVTWKPSMRATTANWPNVGRGMFLKKQMRAARISVPTSGMVNEIMMAHIHPIRCSVGMMASNCLSGSVDGSLTSFQNPNLAVNKHHAMFKAGYYVTFIYLILVHSELLFIIRNKLHF